MFDQDAAQRAATEILASAPRLEGGDGTEIVIPIKALVEAIMAAGNPDGLIVPAYDEALAAEARYRIEQPTKDNPGASMTILAHDEAVALVIRDGRGEQLSAGFVGPDFAWHLGLALCSASQETRRRHSEARS
jgi:hypothetical protein